MQIVAVAKSVRISPRKVRIVADAVRNMALEDALSNLKLIEKRGAYTLEKTIRSAVANAINNSQLERANLAIDRIEITEGQALKRFHPSTRGRVHPYKKRGSNIRVILKERSVTTSPKV